MSFCEVIHVVLSSKDTPIGSSTVLRRIGKRFGLNSHRPVRKPHLSPVLKKRSPDFVRHHRHWTLAEWMKVLFSDEYTMQQCVPRPMHIRRPLGKKCALATMKHPPSQIIWSAMSCRDAAGLHFIPQNTTTNGPMNVELLKENLKLHMHVQCCTIVMQGGAPCHWSKVATEFPKKQQLDVCARMAWEQQQISIQSRTCGLLWRTR